jgi:hypothetical protein
LDAICNHEEKAAGQKMHDLILEVADIIKKSVI